MQQAGHCLWASLPTQPSSRPLSSALLKPYCHVTVSPRAPGGALYIESITTLVSELTNQSQVKTLAIGTFILSTQALPEAGVANADTVRGHTADTDEGGNEK